MLPLRAAAVEENGEIMKATLEFQLPEEQEAFDEALKGGAYRWVLREIQTHIRVRIKHEELPADVRDALEVVSRKLCDLMEFEGIE